MLAFWGDNEVLTAAECTNPDRAVYNSNITVTKPYIVALI